MVSMAAAVLTWWIGLLLVLHVGHVCEEPGQDLSLCSKNGFPVEGNVLVGQRKAVRSMFCSDAIMFEPGITMSLLMCQRSSTQRGTAASARPWTRGSVAIESLPRPPSGVPRLQRDVVPLEERLESVRCGKKGTDR